MIDGSAQSPFDVAVIGLGAMGAHAAMELAARGQKVIGIERYQPGHQLGSSHGDSRLIRLGYFENAAYVPLLKRAYENWRRLMARSGADILTITGVLQIGRPDDPIVSGTLASCSLYNLAHEVLTPAEMARRYPVFQLDDGEMAVLDPQGGFLRPEIAITSALRLAEADGAILHFGARVTALEPHSSAVVIRSEAGTYHARKVIVATGSCIGQLVPSLRDIARPIRQVVGWYEPRDEKATALGQMPAFLRDEGAAGSYFGFPALGPDGVKVGKHAHFNEPIDPEAPNPPVNEADRALLDAFVRHRLPGAAGQSKAYLTCRYTMLPGEDFLIDFLPDEKRIIVASPCSGHGFKFASVVGEILAGLAIHDHTEMDISPFSFERLLARAR